MTTPGRVSRPAPRGGAGAAPVAPVAPIEAKATQTTPTLPQIRGTYTTNHDITQTHRQMLALFEYRRAMVPRHQAELRTLEKKLAGKITPIIEAATRREIEALKKTIASYTSDSDEKAYCAGVATLLAEYETIQQSVEGNLFGRRRAKISDDDQARRLDVIAKYIYEAKKYYDRVDIVRDARQEHTCYCGIPEGKLPIDADGAYYHDCGYSRESETYESDDSPPISSSSGGSDGSKNRENFIKTMACYQAKSPPPRYPSIVAALDQYFASGQLNSTAVKNLTLDDRKRPVGTSFDLMIRALKATEHPQGYPHVYYVLHHYWGWPQEDISALEAQLLEDYDLFQPVYEEIKTGTASFNVHYRLCRHLQRAGYPCVAADFKIPQDTSLARLERQWNICHKKIFGKDAPPLR